MLQYGEETGQFRGILVTENASVQPGDWEVIAHFAGADDTAARVLLDGYSRHTVLTFRRAHGTAENPTAVRPGDSFGGVGGTGYGSTGYNEGPGSTMCYIDFRAAETWTDTEQGAFISFETTAVGTKSRIERVRVHESGSLLIGTTEVLSTSQPEVSSGVDIRPDGSIHVKRDAGTALFLRRDTEGGITGFRHGSATVGSISVTELGTIYNTTSDHRRKPIQEALSGFWERLSKVLPRRFQWDSGVWGWGFIAHEFAEVYPNAVSGEKDGVDVNGEPIYQSMQASAPEVMADVIAALQDIQTRLTALEAK